MDADDLEIISKAAEAAVEAAQRNAPQWYMRGGTVQSSAPGSYVASVLIDGDSEETLVNVIIGQPVHPGQRCQVTFVPPSGAMLTGLIGMAKAVSAVWHGGAGKYLGAGVTTALDLGTPDLSNGEEWETDATKVRPFYAGWYTVTASVGFNNSESIPTSGHYSLQLRRESGGLQQLWWRQWHLGIAIETVPAVFYVDAGTWVECTASNETDERVYCDLRRLSLVYESA